MYVIGLDFGTTNFKALLYEVDGKEVSSAADFYEYVEKLNRGDVIKLQTRWQNRQGNNSDRLVFLQIPSK